MLLKTLLALQALQTGFDTRQVLAVNVPVIAHYRLGHPAEAAGMHDQSTAIREKLFSVDPVSAFDPTLQIDLP